MRALILAAGDGGRLHPLTADAPKPMLPLRGRPIIHHVLDALSASGVDEATVVVGYRAAQLRASLTQYDRPMRFRFVENDFYLEGNARSLWAARDLIDGPFVLAMADHVVAPALVRTLVHGADERCRLAIDRVASGDARAGEATHAQVRDGRVIDLGKQIPIWNALDTGLFWCTPRVFDAITPSMRDGEAGAVFASLARIGQLDAIDVTGQPWIDIDTLDDLRRAEALDTTVHSARDEVA